MRQRHRLYTWTVLLLALGFLIPIQIATVSSTLLGRESGLDWVLLDHQLAKIGTGKSPDTVFLGDSSLGNAISAVEWERLSNGTALNLALTGSFGYEGSRNMLKRVLSWTTPRLVVIVHTANMMQRAPAEDGDRATAQGTERFWAYARRALTWKDALSAYYYWRTIAAGQRPVSRFDARQVIVNDYIKQRPPAAQRFLSFINGFDEYRWESAIRPERVRILQEISAICAAHRVLCVYAHGPLADPPCRANSYFGSVSGILRRSGLVLLSPHAMCMSLDEVGDGEDHVGPDAKIAFTRRYFDLVNQVLPRSNIGMSKP